MYKIKIKNIEQNERIDQVLANHIGKEVRVVGKLVQQANNELMLETKPVRQCVACRCVRVARRAKRLAGRRTAPRV